MGIEFAKSHRSRLGIEWELACVDRNSGELVPAAPELLTLVVNFDGFPQVTGELLTNTLELVSSPSTRVASCSGICSTESIVMEAGRCNHLTSASDACCTA